MPRSTWLDAPNGLSNANGTVNFNGTEAIIQNLTGETGGGKVALDRRGQLRRPRDAVPPHRQRPTTSASLHPESVTTQISAKIVAERAPHRAAWFPAPSPSTMSRCTRTRTSARCYPRPPRPRPRPRPVPAFSAACASTCKIRTAPDVQFRTTLTQNLQARREPHSARHADHPGMLGRVVVTQGEVVFFGSKYTIDQGTVSFLQSAARSIRFSTSISRLPCRESTSRSVCRARWTA